LLEYNAAEIESRHHQIKQLEAEVLEVAEIYKDLQLIVNEQQTSIDSKQTDIQSVQFDCVHTNVNIDVICCVNFFFSSY
jgi:t-SNARE complex subunit (syntaxin)